VSKSSLSSHVSLSQKRHIGTQRARRRPGITRAGMSRVNLR
jgi:hypothetical protein